jgi:hypothetical protein
MNILIRWLIYSLVSLFVIMLYVYASEWSSNTHPKGIALPLTAANSFEQCAIPAGKPAVLVSVELPNPQNDAPEILSDRTRERVLVAKEAIEKKILSLSSPFQPQCILNFSINPQNPSELATYSAMAISY